MTSGPGENQRVYRVSELTRVIRNLLETSVGDLWIEGELSNVRTPASGHIYFTIKDETSQIAAVLFRGSQRGMTFRPADGLQVRAFGQLSVYERSGSYQIIVRRMLEGGKGSLQARFEELKRRLHQEGLFDEDRKRPLPLLPRHVGVVTSASGAAIRDILNVVSRRFPNLHVVLAPVRVQGETAAAEISAAIDDLNRLGGLDVLIVGRGGGSLEDLWCFNEETVARAISRSEIPVISAVGHEIDFTISDFVADLRAPTPSAAAELVVGRKEEFEAGLREAAGRLAGAARQTVLAARNRLLAPAGSYVFREPGNAARRYRQQVETLRLRMVHETSANLREGRQRLDDFGLRSLHRVGLRQQACLQEVRRLASQLKALNPLAVLARGYGITADEDGRIVRSVAAIRPAQRLRTRLAEGMFESTVTAIDSDETRAEDNRQPDGEQP